MGKYSGQDVAIGQAAHMGLATQVGNAWKAHLQHCPGPVGQVNA